jgi:hypothetical protein
MIALVVVYIVWAISRPYVIGFFQKISGDRQFVRGRTILELFRIRQESMSALEGFFIDWIAIPIPIYIGYIVAF